MDTATVAAVDLSTCPLCSHPLEVASVERIYGHQEVTIDRNSDGTYGAEWGGGTDVIWDSSTTEAYICLECREDLPEPYADALDRLLRNNRLIDS